MEEAINNVLQQTRQYYKEETGLDFEFIFGDNKYDYKYGFNDGSELYIKVNLEVKLDGITIYKKNKKPNLLKIERIPSSKIVDKNYLDMLKTTFKLNEFECLSQHLYDFNKYIIDSIIPEIPCKEIIINRRFEGIDWYGEDYAELTNLKIKAFCREQ